jgi:hypothetical protein
MPPRPIGRPGDAHRRAPPSPRAFRTPVSPPDPLPPGGRARTPRRTHKKSPIVYRSFDGSEHTLEEVGQSFQVTRERIRQIEAKALCKLRHPGRSRKLKAFLEGSRIVRSEGGFGTAPDSLTTLTRPDPGTSI